MAGEDFETYDFLINDEDEAMLLFYVREGEPRECDHKPRHRQQKRSLKPQCRR